MNSVDVDYQDRIEQILDQMQTEKVALFVLEREGLDQKELSISYVDDQSIQQLNRDYRQKDEPTDVLSFCQQEEGDEQFPSQEDLLGDIIISVETLKKHSEYFTVEAREECTRLIIHGVLHLLGYDHTTNEASEPMLMRQEELLEAFESLERE